MSISLYTMFFLTFPTFVLNNIFDVFIEMLPKSATYNYPCEKTFCGR